MSNNVMLPLAAAARARRWHWRVALGRAWLAVLATQWLFQPLLYADVLLYYHSFLSLGMGVTEG